MSARLASGADALALGARPGPRINPVAKLGAAVLITGPLILTIDWVSATVALVLVAALLPFAGIGWRQFWLRTLPVWFAAPLAGVSVLLYGRTSGTVYAEWLLVRISDGSIELAVATVLRVLAIGVPAVVLFISIDPTDLADGLAQRLRLPARFVLGALAGFRLVGLFLEDWRSLELARRARGIADRGRLRRFASMAFSLLVLSIRRGSKLAVGMEARAFGGPAPRTWARRSPFGRREIALLIIGAIISSTALTVAILTGNWSFIGAR